MERGKKKYTLQEARIKAESYCAYQERCHSEVKNKLYSWGLPTDHVDAIMYELIQNNFLNEERFSQSFVSGKFNIKRWGKKKIEMELKKKEIHPNLILKSLSIIEDQEYLECISNECKKKLKNTKGSEWERKMKVKQYLYNRGFESELIEKALQSTMNL